MPEQPIIADTITSNGNGGFTGGGDVAARLLAANFNVNALRTNALLRHEEWIAFDNAIIDVARERLVVTQMLLSRGLRYNLPNALGHTRLQWQRNGDLEDAMISMSGLSESQNDRLTFDEEGMPIPIIHKDFNLNIRHLAASRNGGMPLDTMMAQVASRKVSELIESLIFNGATVLGTNNPIYGLRTALWRNTGTLTESWLTADGTDIVHDVIAMVTALQADLMYGPYWMFIGKGVGTRWGEDYRTDSDKTIISRVREIEGIAGITATHNLAEGEVLLVQLTPDVLDIVDGIQPTTIQWDTHAGMVTNFKVLAIMVPRVRNDQDHNSGIAHYSAP